MNKPKMKAPAHVGSDVAVILTFVLEVMREAMQVALPILIGYFLGWVISAIRSWD